MSPIPDQSPFERHIFVCVKERDNGRDCCNILGGLALVKKLRKAVAEAGLYERIRVNKSGCLDRCNPDGPTVVVYPESVWYENSTEQDHNEIIEKYCTQLD
ncbi:MAG TPA: (2Fe-2S) ferredoxin domain-containing protein [Myxococcales bacterium]|nr:(2Fe-2S) ferredoxin domain-containing protein [Myxococcales bacterium]HIN86330.1 (2Fe-2S) ferredoxin domain-containing protein [Myxococcales bacterium]